MTSTLWDQLYHALWETGQRIALAMLRGPEHAEDREDTVATAMEQTVRGHLAKFPQDLQKPPALAHLEPLMRTIVRRRLLDFHRQRYRSKIVPLAEITASTLRSTHPLPDAEMAGQELWATVATLDPPLPDLFTDRFLHGWTTTEIATRRNLNPNTVLSHFHRGFAKLRELLPDHRP